MLGVFGCVGEEVKREVFRRTAIAAPSAALAAPTSNESKTTTSNKVGRNVGGVGNQTSEVSFLVLDIARGMEQDGLSLLA